MAVDPGWAQTPTCIHREFDDGLSAGEGARALFLSIFEQASDAVFAVGSDGCVNAWNHAAEVLYGRSHDEVVGEPVSILDCTGEEGFWLSLAAEVTERNEPSVRDGCCRRPDGSQCYVGFSISPLRSASGSFQGFAVICRDMTPQHQSQEALEHSLAEKELLLKEIHHRVKNNLQVICSLLRLQASYLDDGYAKWMFRNSEERVKCMALVHERLYRSGSMSRVNFRGYVEELVVELMRTYALEPSAIELVLDLEDIELSIDRAVPCGLIVNELVTNALKHAYASGRHGKLAISLRQLDSLVRLSVADDGPGLSEEIDLDDAKTLGLRVVHTLGMQLGADVSIGRRFGTRFDVTFESERKRPREWR